MPVVRLTTKSKFYIDLKFWEQQGKNFRQEVYDSLCDECKAMYSLDTVQLVDHIDPQTGEVKQMDAMLDCASEVCAQDKDFVPARMPLTRAIFRAFIAAGNMPQSAEDIYARIKKGSPAIILRELMSVQMEDEGVTPI